MELTVGLILKRKRQAMYQIEINEGRVYDIGLNKNGCTINDNAKSASVHKIREGIYQILLNHQVYVCRVSRQDSKQFSIAVGTRDYQVQVRDSYDQLLERLGLDFGESDAPDDIIAPMPGRVLDVAVKPGETVEKGQSILVLEAMKMENVIKANGNGIVSTITVKPGDALEKGQILVTFTSAE